MKLGPVYVPKYSVGYADFCRLVQKHAVVCPRNLWGY